MRDEQPNLAMEAMIANDDPEHPLVACLLLVNYDGSVSVLARRGCTDADIRELLTTLASGLATTAPTP